MSRTGSPPDDPRTSTDRSCPGHIINVYKAFAALVMVHDNGESPACPDIVGREDEKKYGKRYGKRHARDKDKAGEVAEPAREPSGHAAEAVSTHHEVVETEEPVDCSCA